MLLSKYKRKPEAWNKHVVPHLESAAAAAKSLQSCPTLCDPIDGSPPGSPVPGILQARTLECVGGCIIFRRHHSSLQADSLAAGAGLRHSRAILFHFAQHFIPQSQSLSQSWVWSFSWTFTQNAKCPLIPFKTLPLQIELVNTGIFFYTYNESSQFNGLKNLRIER